MRFIQLVEYETERADEIESRFREMMQSPPGDMASLVRVAHTRDHDNPSHYVDIIEFTTYEEAMANSGRPETDAMAKELSALCTRGPSYANLDVMMESPN